MIQDLIIRIKNASAVGHAHVKVPYTTLNQAVLDLLSRHRYIISAAKKGRGIKKIIDITLKYDADGSPRVTAAKFFSLPSKRVYVSYQDLKPVRQGFGLGVVSTPKGLKTTVEAKRDKVGGEYLFAIW